MEPVNNDLLRVFLDVYQNKHPDQIRPTKDGLWVAELALQDGGDTALLLQCFGLDGRECLRKEAHRMDAQCPAPYCWFTDGAVVLLHAPEDPADPDEDPAVTLRWFPLDTLEEQVWQVQPRQLPGALSGVIRHWSEGEILTVQATFCKEDDVQTAYVSFDLVRRRVSVSKPKLFGIFGKGEPQPPQHVPDPDRLVAEQSMADMINSGFVLPDGTILVPTALQADEKYCRVECNRLPPNSTSSTDIRRVVFTGPHFSLLCPLNIEGYRYILNIPQSLFMPMDDLAGPFPEKTTPAQPIELVHGGTLLEVERAFADAHLSRPCRDEALYRDDTCYRWRLDHAAWAVYFELPGLFVPLEFVYFFSKMAQFCRPYLRSLDLPIPEDSSPPSLWKKVEVGFPKHWEASLPLLLSLPDYKIPQIGPLLPGELTPEEARTRAMAAAELHALSDGPTVSTEHIDPRHP